MSKQRVSLYLPSQLAERVRRAVYYTPGVTLSSLTQKGLKQVVDQMEIERGEPFPEREGALRRGRPVEAS